MRTTNPVMVGVDGAWKHTGAVEWALDEALRTGAPLRVLHVADASYGQLPQLIADSVDVRARELIGDVGEHVKRAAPSLRLSSDALWGDPGAALAKAAGPARVLVVGRRGEGTFRRLLVGSTAERAVAESTVPVVVVPEQWRPAEHRTGPVLLGLDAEAPSSAALEFAFGAAGNRCVPLRLLYAWELPPGIRTTGQTGAVERERRKWESFDNLVDAWRDKHPGVDVRLVMPDRHPVDALVREADSSNAQLIVVGGHPHNRLTGFLLGSVARGVLHHADRPVAVVHDTRPTEVSP